MSREEFGGLTLKTKPITKTVLRVTIHVKSALSDDEFDSFIAHLKELYERTRSARQEFCTLVRIEDITQLGVTQPIKFAKFLNEHRTTTQELSTGCAIVMSRSACALVNSVFAFYKPTKHVERTHDLVHAKQYLRQVSQRQ